MGVGALAYLDGRTRTDADGLGRTRTDRTDPDGPGRTRTDPDGPDGQTAMKAKHYTHPSAHAEIIQSLVPH